MIEIEELNKFLNKRGLWDTLKILGEYSNFQTTLHEFFSKLNSFSYYNSFSRIKKQLIERDLLKIERVNNKRVIKLTDKGINIYKKLIEILNLIKNHEV